jgi:hypothetical protein
VTEYGFHPVCLAFPAMPEGAYKRRLADYRAHPERAQDTAVLLAQDDDGQWKIADGRHHFLICRELGYECEFQKFTGTRAELVALVTARNINRRHQTESQIAAKHGVKSPDQLRRLWEEARDQGIDAGDDWRLDE